MGYFEIDGVRPVVAETAYVHPSAVVIGDVHIADGAYIGPHASLRGDFGRIIIGAGSNVQDSCVLHCFPDAACDLASNVHVGHGAILHGCTAESYAMIGMNAVVMDGVHLGAECLVAAGSFVPAATLVPARHLIAGNPARVVRELDETTLVWKARGVQTYQRLAERCVDSLVPCTPDRALQADRPALRPGNEGSVPLHLLRQRSNQATE